MSELSSALQSLAPPLSRQPGEFTVYDIAGEWSMTIKGAATRLGRMTASGELIKREGRDKSKVVTFYRKA